MGRKYKQNTYQGKSISRRTILRSSAAAIGVGSGIVGESTGVVGANKPKNYTYDIMGGTDHETTVHIYDSNRSGPTTVVVGGLHGDEQSGVKAATDIADWTVKKGYL